MSLSAVSHRRKKTLCGNPQTVERLDMKSNTGSRKHDVNGSKRSSIYLAPQRAGS
jgi:hypothetical protein